MCIYVYIDLSICVYICIYIYINIYTYMYVCMYVYMYIYIQNKEELKRKGEEMVRAGLEAAALKLKEEKVIRCIHEYNAYICIYMCIYVFVFLFMYLYLYVYIYIYIYICIFTYIQAALLKSNAKKEEKSRLDLIEHKKKKLAEEKARTIAAALKLKEEKDKREEVERNSKNVLKIQHRDLSTPSPETLGDYFFNVNSLDIVGSHYIRNFVQFFIRASGRDIDVDTFIKGIIFMYMYICMCIYIYMSLCIHIYIYMCISNFIQFFICVNGEDIDVDSFIKGIYTYIYMYLCMYVHIHI
jgi:hypothetical protein